MSIDRFFALGSGMPLHVNDVFVDRERYIETYRRRAEAHCVLAWDVDRLVDSRRPARNVMLFLGEGGIGKSSLVGHLANLSVTRQLPDLPADCASVLIDFADVANLSFETVLLRLRVALGGLAPSWPAFDLALALYWERKHPGESLVAFLRRSSTLGTPAQTLLAGEQVLTAVQQLLGGFGGESLTVRLTELCAHEAADALTVRRLWRDLPPFEAAVEELNADEMLGHLPALLAYDLERARAKRPVLAVCQLDTFERVQGLPAGRRSLEDLVARMIYLTPNVLFLVASRHPLTWHEPACGAELTYGGPRRWPGLAGADPADQVRVERLADDAAQEYVRARLTLGGEPALSAAIRQRVVAGARGSPHYLALSAELFGQLAARGVDPRPEEFGRPFPELVLRLMRELSIGDRDLMRAAALLEAFDEEILSVVVPSVPGWQIDEFLRRGLVRWEETVWPPYRLHDDLRRAVTACDDRTPDGWTAAERRRRLLRAMAYLEELALAAWDTDRHLTVAAGERSRRTVAAFLLALYAAAEHRTLPRRLGQVAYAVRELGHGQVLTSLPDYAHRNLPALAGLTAIARLAARGDLDVGSRYEQMRAARESLPDDTYRAYADYELGNLAFFAGAPSEAERYFTLIADEGSILGCGAQLGLAGNALRQSRFTAVMGHLRKPAEAGVERGRVAELLGHLHLHNGSFEQAAALFTETLSHALHVGVKYWVGQALRHLALACVWFDPERAAAVIPEGRELNRSLGDVVGVAQCDMAAALSHAYRAEWVDAERCLAQARAELEAVEADFEMLPVVPVEVLVHLGQGRTTQARAATYQLIAAARTGRPCGPPVWSAVTALWVGRPEWCDFDQIDWIEPETARQRWSAPANRLKAVGQWHAR